MRQVNTITCIGDLALLIQQESQALCRGFGSRMDDMEQRHGTTTWNKSGHGLQTRGQGGDEDRRHDDLEKRIEAMEKHEHDRPSEGLHSGGAGPSIPRHLRRTPFVVGFPRDSRRCDVIEGVDAAFRAAGVEHEEMHTNSRSTSTANV